MWNFMLGPPLINCLFEVLLPTQFSPITVDFQLVVQKLRREFTHAQNFLFKIPAQVRACADSRRDFWTTNWKSTVLLPQLLSVLRMRANLNDP